ncbi:MAG: glycosyltransferase family 4 protein [Gammaproteobacteria bacterium]
MSVLITGLTRRHALRKGMIDMPNQRSSHTVPTARGGGLAIAMTFVGAILGLQITGVIASDIAWALTGGGALIAVTGWIDDRINVPISWRFLAHFVAAFWALFWLGGMASLQLGSVTISWGWPGWIVAAVGIVWLTNLYNFMDGIDGLAGMQAVVTGIGGGLLLGLSGAYELALASLVLAAASAGFLTWNWPPARVFMGDVGSGLLGFSFAVLAIASEKSGALPVLGWTILLAIFVMDATFTLLRRMVHKEAWLQAHCTHAYQRVVQLGASHLQVTLSILFLNIFVLWPLAWIVWWQPRWLLWIFLSIGGLAWILWLTIQHKADKAGKIR